jgi:hypothetical protein
MLNQLVNYAFTSAIYEEKRNFLETYSPFVLKVLYDKNCQITDKDLAEELNSVFQIDIPVNTVKSIISGLSKHDLVDKKTAVRESWQVCITEKGKKEVEQLNENEENVRRRQNHLITSFVTFLNKKGLKKTNDQAEELILNFVHHNLHKLSLFNIDDIDYENQDEVFSESENFVLTQFIDEIYTGEPILYQTYEEILKGLIIREYIKANEDTTVIPKLENLTVYLDANIVISLLEFHNPAINSAAKQLISLLKATEGIKLKIFSITLEEIARLLTNYKHLKDNYSTSIPVNSVFYYLKSQGYNDMKTDSLIAELDIKIESLGIVVENLPITEENRLHGNDKELYQDIYTYKNEQNKSRTNGLIKDERVIHTSALHDANIIIAIQKKRGSWVKTLERSKAIFLTSSFLMDQFCKRISRLNDRFPEVILDLTLTNILWLRNPKKEIGIHLHQLISAHSKRFIVDNGIWSRFFSIIKSMNEDGVISTENLASVISNNQITLDYLHQVNVEDISVDSVLELAKKVENNIKRKDELLNEKERLLAETLTEKEINDRELLRKSSVIDDLKSENDELKNKLESTSNDVTKLKEEKELQEYIDKKLDEEFYPLSKKFSSLLLWLLAAILMIFIAEIMDERMFYKTGFNNWLLFVIVKISGFLGLFFFTLINIKNMLNIVQYRINHSLLKRKFEKQFKSEFLEIKRK